MSFFSDQAGRGAEEQMTEMVFTVRVHPDEDDGGYWGEVLELEGCVSQGETLDELTENVKEAILSWIEASRDDAGKVPKQGITMSVPVLVPC
jgi:predicted RNase H-like HicB family nuclease